MPRGIYNRSSKTPTKKTRAEKTALNADFGKIGADPVRITDLLKQAFDLTPSDQVGLYECIMLARYFAEFPEGFTSTVVKESIADLIRKIQSKI